MKYSGLLTSLVVSILVFVGEEAAVAGAPMTIAEPVYKRALCTGGSASCPDWKRQDGGLGQEIAPAVGAGEKRQDGGLGQETVPLDANGKREFCTGNGASCADWKRQDGGLGQETVPTGGAGEKR
ncbi:hypothetical protein C8T65DRAFT_779878 [Cerioporus squamosus]|nr:hypothetical protein C8T65DRAFT_779878 [Cerioporus squamosus]